MTLKNRLARLERALRAKEKEPVTYRIIWLGEDEEPEPGAYTIRLQWGDEDEEPKQPDSPT